jgi:serine/threonine protein phosphatase PrpC
MGTTCTAVALIGDLLYYGHVGDTRLYLIRNGAIRRLTHDHSLVQRLVDSGVITEEQAAGASRPQRAGLGPGNERRRFGGRPGTGVPSSRATRC